MEIDFTAEEWLRIQKLVGMALGDHKLSKAEKLMVKKLDVFTAEAERLEKEEKTTE